MLILVSFIKMLQPAQYAVSASPCMVVVTLWYPVLVQKGVVTSQVQAGFHSVEGFQQKRETHNFYPAPLQDSASCLKLKCFNTTFVC